MSQPILMKNLNVGGYIRELTNGFGTKYMNTVIQNQCKDRTLKTNYQLIFNYFIKD